jgi:hypothetical protein
MLTVMMMRIGKREKRNQSSHIANSLEKEKNGIKAVILRIHFESVFPPTRRRSSGSISYRR